MNHAVVTGATGFVGAHLAVELLSRGLKVTALCRDGSPNLSRLPSEVDIIYSLNDIPPADVFYHLAWEGASGALRTDAAVQAFNAQFTVGTLKAAQTAGCKKYVALGTVYERLTPQILASGKFGGSDFYVLSKRYACAMADKLAYKLGVDFSWCRICHPIGKYIKPEQLMAYTVSNLISGSAPSFGPASTLYDVAAVEDVASGLYLAGEYGKRREYYIGSGAPHILREYLERTREILLTSTPLHIGARPDDGLRFQREWFDITPLTEDTGYAPKVSFEEAVMNVKDWAEGF